MKLTNMKLTKYEINQNMILISVEIYNIFIQYITNLKLLIFLQVV